MLNSVSLGLERVGTTFLIMGTNDYQEKTLEYQSSAFPVSYGLVLFHIFSSL